MTPAPPARVRRLDRISLAVAVRAAVQQARQHGDAFTLKLLMRKAACASFHRILNPVIRPNFGLCTPQQFVVGFKSLARDRSPEPASLKRAAR